jgi:NDP-sugar pyrophosphorylase family protein
MLAVLLAGGKGARLGNPAQMYSKPLVPIGVQPVINHIIDKLLMIDEVTHIYILTRKSQVTGQGRNKHTLNLFDKFNDWRQVCYKDSTKVEVRYEEDLPTFQNNSPGAIPGLKAFIDWLSSEPQRAGFGGILLSKPSLLVIAADNYFEDDLANLVLNASAFPRAVINAYFDFGDKERLRRKYGSIEVDRDGWVTKYEEKPQDPGPDQTIASTGIYVFPWEHMVEIQEYVTAGSPYGTEGPGNMLAWFVQDVFSDSNSDLDDLRRQRIGVRGYELQGEWFDIGRVPDLLAATKYYLDRYLLCMETVDDLLLADMARELNDKYFLLCHRLEIVPRKRTIKMCFEGSDKICKLHADLPGNIQSIDEVREASSAASYWSGIIRALRESSNKLKLDLVPPILISGGVFLFDTVDADNSPGRGGTRLGRRRTLIPLLERDAASKADPGRLTTPAGRMDTLDLRQVCFRELYEEMVFYADLKGSPVIRCFVPPGYMRDVRRAVLQRLVRNRVSIPNIPSERLLFESQLPEKKIELVTISVPHQIQFPEKVGWKIQFWLGGELRSECDNVIIIPDKDNGTLELRLAYFADITETHDNAFPVCNRYSKQVGSLLGIADGDGHLRRPFLISAESLQAYYTKIKNLGKQGRIVDYLTSSHRDSVDIVAVGRPGDGRFEEFECRMPTLALTTSVRYLAELLDTLLR